MRRPSTALVVFLALLTAQPSATQQTSATPAQRDPQAVAILSQAVTAAGGVNALSAILNLTATGQVSFYWGGEAVQGTVTMRCHGINRFRLDATLPDGAHSWIATVGAALEKHPDGTITPMPFQNTLKPACVAFPFIPLVAALGDPTTSISYVGLVTHDGQQAHDIRVQRNFQANSDPFGAQSALTRMDFFIDPNTLLILSLQDMAYRKDNEPGESPRELQFSGYQSASGIAVPFSIKELIGAQQTVTIQLSQFTFNSGLTDADFTL
jgi:hypothetical protein